MLVETRLCSHFRKTKVHNTQVHVRPFIESIVRKVALIHGNLRLSSYAGGTLRKKFERFWRMPGVRSAPQRFPACLANPSPMMMSGFLLPVCQALALAFVGAAAGCELLILSFLQEQKIAAYAGSGFRQGL
ncbi:hypothetical protein [Pseudomonas frederiksbergensis]|uniref:hypothetical protein n=1 Tax=Pseudomonas frederiksbergensis TaxID=104087 RepID=UPI0011CD9741|nr:hypothetical protein [Pseudomonas frederiksbergensis]